MKITDLIYKTVVAFDPKEHPIYSLAALAMILTTLVLLAHGGAAGATNSVHWLANAVF